MSFHCRHSKCSDEEYNKTSTIASSQIPIPVWYDIIGEGTIADAILDRLVNSSYRIYLKGESRRKIYYLFCSSLYSLKTDNIAKLTSSWVCNFNTSTFLFI
ncbi:MAG: ATP-binding protein [Bacteroidales bacterium]